MMAPPGLGAVKERGGAAIIQHPEEAVASGMPLNALKHVEVDHILRLSEIPSMLVRLANMPAQEKGGTPVSKQMETEVKIAQEDNALDSGIVDWGEPSIYACPECHGVLLQLKEGSNLRFRCHTGHAYSVESLLSELNDKSEEPLWNAVRALDEMVLLMRRMAAHLNEHKHADAAAALRQKADERYQRAEHIRQIVLRHEKAQPGKPNQNKASAE